MTDLQKLTEMLGGAKETAKVLNVTLRTYWNYKKGNIPERMQRHISLLVKDQSDPLEQSNDGRHPAP